MKENTQDENETEAQVEKATRDEQYVAIVHSRNEGRINVMGVYDDYDDAQQSVEDEIKTQYARDMDPLADEYEVIQSERDKTVYYSDDARILDYQIQTVSQ